MGWKIFVFQHKKASEVKYFSGFLIMGKLKDQPM